MGGLNHQSRAHASLPWSKRRWSSVSGSCIVDHDRDSQASPTSQSRPMPAICARVRAWALTLLRAESMCRGSCTRSRPPRSSPHCRPRRARSPHNIGKDSQKYHHSKSRTTNNWCQRGMAGPDPSRDGSKRHRTPERSRGVPERR